MTYSHLNFWGTPTITDLQKWASVGRLYHEYGMFLIKTHPIEFAHYYIGQGIDWFANPIVDISNVYPDGGLEIRGNEMGWFGYPSNWIKYTKSKLYSFTYFPFVVTALNALYLLSIIGFIYYRCYKTVGKSFNRILFLTGAFWLSNFLFGIVSAPFVLRYALFE